MFIYKITNKINKKFYIGKTCNTINKRWGKHVEASINYRGNSVLHSAIRKYGKENFEIEILVCVLDKQYLDEMEIYFIKFYNSFIPNGYNMTFGGDGGHTISWTDERKKIASERMKGSNNPMYGKTHSDEYKNWLSQKYSGKNNPRFGKELSKEHIEILNKAKMKKVKGIHAHTKEEIYFDSVSLAAKHFNTTVDVISKALHSFRHYGKQHKSHGYYWEFVISQAA